MKSNANGPPKSSRIYKKIIAHDNTAHELRHYLNPKMQQVRGLLSTKDQGVASSDNERIAKYDELKMDFAKARTSHASDSKTEHAKMGGFQYSNCKCL